MATLEFDATLFRAQFPNQFPDPPNTDAILELYWNTAICYVSPETGGLMSAACRRQIINLVVGHLITIAANATAGQQTGFVESASIDKISVSVQSFETKSQFQWWLQQTPYGQQALAQLSASIVGGVYIGGRNELGSFRRSGGVFTPASRTLTQTPAEACPILVLPPVSVDLAAGDLSGFSDIIEAPTGCTAFVISFTDASAPTVFELQIFTAIVDNGQRYNVYYWDSDARAGVGPPTHIAKNISIFGAIPGFTIPGLVSGSTANDPNLVVITGFESNALGFDTFVQAV